MNETRDVDVAVIGAGTAGMAAYRAAIKRNKKTVLIEGATYGTTCARVGCMPSKLLIAAANAAHDARVAGPLGVRSSVTVDGRKVMERVRKERDRFVGFVLESIEGFRAEDRLLGQARFVSPHELDVAGTRVKARAIVVATGSKPVIPTVFEAVRDRLSINDDVFAWDDLPESAVVFGAGVIGLELGQALHRLGVRVRIFGRGGTVGPLRDPVAKQVAAKVFRSELAVDFDAKVLSVEPDGESGVRVRFIDETGEKTETFAKMLVAAGRRPNLGGLGLEVFDDGGGLIHRHTLQWGNTHVFIAGDASDDLTVLHEAADEGAIAGENAALYPDIRRGTRRSGLAVAFTEPGLALVGGGLPDVPYHVGQVDFGDQGRSRIMLQNHGIGRLYADDDGRFLGAELVAPRAEHLAHLLAWAHQSGMTVDRMLSMPFYHPVIEEGLRTALRDLAKQLDMNNAPPLMVKDPASAANARPTGE